MSLPALDTAAVLLRSDDRFIISSYKGQTWAALPCPAWVQPGQVVQAMHHISSLCIFFHFYPITAVYVVQAHCKFNL